jgi:hypothetical protein
VKQIHDDREEIEQPAFGERASDSRSTFAFTHDFVLYMRMSDGVVRRSRVRI